MSLTKHLKGKNSPIRQFFRERFPNTRPIVTEVNAHLRSLDTEPIYGNDFIRVL